MGRFVIRPSLLPEGYAPPHGHAVAGLCPIVGEPHACASQSDGLTVSPLGGEHHAIHPVCVYRQHLSQPDPEDALKAKLDPRSAIRVSSAGIEAVPQAGASGVTPMLVQRGMDPSLHRQRRVSAELLRVTGLVIAIGRIVKPCSSTPFEYRAPLFDQRLPWTISAIVGCLGGSSHLGNGPRCGSALCVPGDGVHLGVHPMYITASRDLSEG